MKMADNSEKMAAGMDPAPENNDRLTDVISTLQGCLNIAAPEVSKPETPKKAKIEKAKEVKEEASCSKDVKEEKEVKAEICCGGNVMPDGGKWPHCQHTITTDDNKGPLSDRIQMVQYRDEAHIADVMRLMTKDLSEPYSIYTYRFFVHNWPELCILAFDSVSAECVGAVVGKLEQQPDGRRRGYVAMLAVDESCRKMGLGTRLVRRAIENMQVQGCDEVYLETEVTNTTAQGLYEKLGFIRDKRLIKYYLNGNDAFRLKLFFSRGLVA